MTTKIPINNESRELLASLFKNPLNEDARFFLAASLEDAVDPKSVFVDTGLPPFAKLEYRHEIPYELKCPSNWWVGSAFPCTLCHGRRKMHATKFENKDFTIMDFFKPVFPMETIEINCKKCRGRGHIELAHIVCESLPIASVVLSQVKPLRIDSFLDLKGPWFYMSAGDRRSLSPWVIPIEIFHRMRIQLYREPHKFGFTGSTQRTLLFGDPNNREAGIYLEDRDTLMHLLNRATLNYGRELAGLPELEY